MWITHCSIELHPGETKPLTTQYLAIVIPKPGSFPHPHCLAFILMSLGQLEKLLNDFIDLWMTASLPTCDGQKQLRLDAWHRMHWVCWNCALKMVRIRSGKEQKDMKIWKTTDGPYHRGSVVVSASGMCSGENSLLTVIIIEKQCFRTTDYWCFRKGSI